MVDIYSDDALLCWPVEFLPGKSGERTYHVTAAWIPKVSVSKDEILEAVREDSGFMHGSDWYRLAEVIDTAAFGPDANIPVLKVAANDTNVNLSHNRRGIIRLLEDRSIFADKTYPYNPHVTVPLHRVLNPPKYVLLRPLELWYKDDEPVVV